MNIDERIQALTMNLELSWKEIEATREHAREQDSRIDKLAAQHNEHIARILAIVESRAEIAQNHERRLTRLGRWATVMPR